MINCVYLHIPFCEKKCNYCAFCSYATLKNKDEYVSSLLKEIKFHYKNNYLKTIYFGGGTPSLLDKPDIEQILNCFNYDKNTEVTLEANPNSLDKNKLMFYKSIGINRLSLGVQSFNDDILSLIGRCHSSKDIYRTIEDIKNLEFDNFSIDLMYGLPSQNLEDWKKTLLKALEINPPHISLYGLKIEKGTVFYKYPPENLPDDDIQSKMYNLAIEILADKYFHYEFSNFALNNNYISKHNTNYWKRGNYFGFGLSASGFIDNKRYTNTFNLKEYNLNPTEKKYEILSKQNQIEEEIFLGLRLSEGINFNQINKKYNIDIYKKYSKIFEKYLKDGYFIKTDNGIKFSKKGILVSNEILCEFIEV